MAMDDYHAAMKTAISGEHMRRDYDRRMLTDANGIQLGGLHLEV